MPVSVLKYKDCGICKTFKYTDSLDSVRAYVTSNKFLKCSIYCRIPYKKLFDGCLKI